MASVALLHCAVERSPRAAALTPEEALELALLGITMAQPLALDRIGGLLSTSRRRCCSRPPTSSRAGCAT
jgi:hypothetical protein